MIFDARISTFLFVSVPKSFHTAASASIGRMPSCSSCCTGSNPCITCSRCACVSRRVGFSSSFFAFFSSSFFLPSAAAAAGASPLAAAFFSFCSWRSASATSLASTPPLGSSDFFGFLAPSAADEPPPLAPLPSPFLCDGFFASFSGSSSPSFFSSFGFSSV